MTLTGMGALYNALAPAKFSTTGIRKVVTALAAVQPGFSAMQLWMNDTLMSNTS